MLTSSVGAATLASSSPRASVRALSHCPCNSSVPLSFLRAGRRRHTRSGPHRQSPTRRRLGRSLVHACARARGRAGVVEGKRSPVHHSPERQHRAGLDEHATFLVLSPVAGRGRRRDLRRARALQSCQVGSLPSSGPRPMSWSHIGGRLDRNVMPPQSSDRPIPAPLSHPPS